MALIRYILFCSMTMSAALSATGQRTAAAPAKQDTVFLEGFINADQTLSPGKIYVLKHNVKIAKNATLTVPGNTILLLDFNVSIVAEGGLNFNGSPGAWIEVSSRDPRNPGKGILVRTPDGKDIDIKYTRFSQINEPLRFDNDWFRNNVRIQNNIFTNIFTGEPTIYVFSPNSMVQGRKASFIFSNNSYISNWGSIFIDNFQSDVLDMEFSNNLFTNNVVYAIKQGDPSKALIYGMFDDVPSKHRVRFFGNSIFGNYQINSAADTIIREVGIGIQGSGESLDIPENFFRSTDPNYISSTFDHFYQNSSLPLLRVEPVATSPSESIHPHIWKVNLNGTDITNYSTLPSVTNRDAMFEVYFNKPVDAFGDRQFESILYDTSRNELIVNPVQTSDAKWSPDRKKYSFKISNASFLNSQIGYVVISNFRDKDGLDVPQFTIGQPRALNNYRAIASGGRKAAEMISRPDEGSGIDVDIDRGAFLSSRDQVAAFKQLTNLGDLSYLGPYESLAKTWEAGLMLGASNYTGTFTDVFAKRGHYRFSGGIFAQYNRHKWYSLRAMLWMGKISGSDITNSSLSDRGRLSEFKNFLFEGSLTFHWHLLPYGTNRGERFVPTIFAGVALFRSNPMSRIYMTLDYEGNPQFVRWNSELNTVAVDWMNNSDGYQDSKDIWVYLQQLGTEGQTVQDKKDPEADSDEATAVFFQDRTAPDKYRKVQVSFPVGFEFSWLIRNTWNIGAHIGIRFTTTRYIDDIGGYFFDRMNNHQAIVDANLGNIKGKAGRKKIDVPDVIAFAQDNKPIADYATAALLANPSLVLDYESKNYAYNIDGLANQEARRTQKNFDNYDMYFFAGVKASYIFKRKKDKEANEKYKKKLDDAYQKEAAEEGKKGKKSSEVKEGKPEKEQKAEKEPKTEKAPKEKKEPKAKDQ